MTLTQDDIERYAPYHTMEAFRWGYEFYMAGKWVGAEPLSCNADSVAGQAYDRGAECAMRHAREAGR